MSISDQKKRQCALVSFCILATISAIIVMTGYQIKRRDNLDQTKKETTVVSIQMNENTTSCSNELMILLGDGFCDDEANNHQCDFDDGDCCGTTSFKVNTQNCLQCMCFGMKT